MHLHCVKMMVMVMMAMMMVVIVMMMIWWWWLGGHYGLMDSMYLNYVNTNCEMLHWLQKLARTICGHTMQAEWNKIGSWSRIIMVITGSERAALLHWRRREKVKNQAMFPPRFCTRKTCWGLFTLTRLEGKLSWIWFYVEHSGLKSRKRGFPKNGIIPNQKGVG